MNFIIWLLKLFGLNSWAAAIEAKLRVDKQEADARETEIQQEVEDEKADVADAPDSELPDILQRLHDAAEARAKCDGSGGE